MRRVAGLRAAALIAAAWLLCVPGPALADALDARLLIVVDAEAAGSLSGVAEDYGLVVQDSRPLATLGVRCAVATLGDAADPAAVLARLRADPRVRDAQPELVHRLAGMPPKDPYFDVQMRTRQGGVSSVLHRGSGLRVRIALIDTGVDASHPDLEGQFETVRNFVGGNPDLVPAEYHGTAVAGLIAARAGNGVGIHGLAPESEIHALRACWEPTYGYGLCSTYTLAQALDYAIEIRARLINLSLAGPKDPLLARLVERATELGAVVFGAVGEDPIQDFPASVAAVVAVEQGDGRSDAAGELVGIPGQQLLTTVPGGWYDFVTGSSFATAHATGVAAVMLEQQPHLQGADLADWLRRVHDTDR